jgi:hypothetical protein
MTQAAELHNALNIKNMDISAQFAQTKRHAAIAAKTTTQRYAQIYRLRHAGAAQPATEDNIHHGPENALRGSKR